MIISHLKKNIGYQGVWSIRPGLKITCVGDIRLRQANDRTLMCLYCHMLAEVYLVLSLQLRFSSLLQGTINTPLLALVAHQ